MEYIIVHENIPPDKSLCSLFPSTIKSEKKVRRLPDPLRIDVSFSYPDEYFKSKESPVNQSASLIDINISPDHL